ncbi:MAG: hypothetical protein ABSC64_02180 [Candidatus Korobacteraceae bacterium]
MALTLSTINNTAAIVSVTPTTAIALTLATLAASASTISPSVGIGVDIILSTLGLTSAVIPVSPQAAGRVNIVLSPIGTNTSVIAPHITADANLTVPTLNASASAITPSVAMVIHIIMATLGVSATAIAPEITADCNLTLSPIATSASTFDVSVAISIMLAVLAAESAMLVNNETLSIYNPATNELWAAEAVAPISIENEILIAGLALQEITTLLANESVAPAANVNEDVTIIDEEGNETSGNVLENIWRPAAVPQVETLVITETSSVEAIPEE